MMAWAVIVAVGVGSYCMRALPLVLDRHWTSSPQFEKSIGHAGTAALAALIVAGLRRGSTTPADAVAMVTAAAVGLVAVLRGAAMLRVLLVGAVTYAAVLGGLALLS